jgi:plastocyanin
MVNKTTIIVLVSIVAIAGGSYAIGKRIAGGSSSSATTTSQTPGYKEFDIVIQNNRYNPSTVTVNQGDRVVINVTNRDQISHGIAIPEFGATVPGGHAIPGRTVTMDFLASRKTTVDAAVCGGARPEDKTDTHGEELIVNVI